MTQLQAPCQPRDGDDATETDTEIERKIFKTPKIPRRRQRNPIVTNNDLETLTSTVEISLAISQPLLLSMSTPIRVLVCSIGNPGPYINTLHSAGHTVLSSLASSSLSYPPFAKSRQHGNGLLSAGADFTLWQSSSLMNISGSGVAAAWRQFKKDSRGEQTRLVVVHDELEIKLGYVRVKNGDASPKGHNGLKSVKELVKDEWWRIGVGIGRPESREPDAVAAFVLRKMSGVEKARIEGAVGMVDGELRRLAAG